jgi:hypothetical protein
MEWVEFLHNSDVTYLTHLTHLTYLTYFILLKTDISHRRNTC